MVIHIPDEVVDSCPLVASRFVDKRVDRTGRAAVA